MSRNVGALTRLIQREPVAFQGCVQATLAALVGFGLVHWSSEQVGLVLGLVAALLAFFTRAKVSPTPMPMPTTPPDQRSGPSHDHRGMSRPSGTSTAAGGSSG